MKNGKGDQSLVMSQRAFGAVTAGAAASLLAEVGIASSGLLGWSGSIALNKGWELVAAVVAMLAWLWSAVRSSGPWRQWRWWMTAAATCFVVGLAAWSWGQVIIGIPLPTETLGPAGYLLTAVLALLAVTVRTSVTGTEHDEPLQVRQHRTVRVLDVTIIFCSIVLFGWVTLGRELSMSWTTSGPIVALLVAHPLVYLLLVGAIVMLARLRPGGRGLPVLFIALAATAYVVSSTLFAHFVDAGGTRIPPALEAGFMACPVLFFLAALAPDNPTPVPHADKRRSAVDLAHLVVPYLPLIATGVFLAAELAAGVTLSPSQEALSLALLGLVIGRQVATLAENDHLLRELKHQALHDPLTGLANRTLFLYHLHRLVAPHNGTRSPVVVAFCDVDDFKNVNDRFGHTTGDLILQGVAERLRHCARNDGVVARLGGDEFAVALWKCHGDNDIGQRLRAALGQPYVVDGRPLAVSTSVGVTHLPEDEQITDIDQLLRLADTAMYRAKRLKNTPTHTAEPHKEHV
ncbi:diguanylate cyclase domain-containing protein [Nocardia terpenica]|uniref:diguanylate cyclase domain-containing protein n=2 Tax=Nocardia terpenica TaxID=455432 RepID=UPI002B4B73E2|nr:diguanylate cyclase [Nocardia terpenica]